MIPQFSTVEVGLIVLMFGWPGAILGALTGAVAWPRRWLVGGLLGAVLGAAVWGGTYVSV